MPIKRRTPKRRAAVLPDPCWRHLADVAEDGDEGCEEMIGFEYFGSPLEIEEAWARFGEEATAAYAWIYPGCRPRLWWLHSTPEPERRKVAGTGQPSGSVLVRGVSLYNDEDPADPALVESEAAYLARLGLLLPGERRRLTAADFEPELATPWGDDGDDDPPPGAARPARRAA